MKVCALIPNRPHIYNKEHGQRLNTNKYYGLKIIINEIEIYWKLKVDFVDINEVDKYDIVLYSMLSIEDYYNLVYTIERKYKRIRRNKWIVGGAGISNINPLIDYFDYIVLGRGETLINELISSILKNKDVESESIVQANNYNPLKQYKLKYTNELYKGSSHVVSEKMYGCKYNCFYCRYRTATLPPNLRSLDKETTMPGNEETFWELEIKNGSFYTTSLDGMTEKIRYAVNKKISNKLIVKKILEASKITRVINLKIYFIIGYPNINLVDFSEFINVCREIENNINDCQVLFKLHFTPFGAEPHTPMQWEKVNINIDYRDYMDNLKSYNKYVFHGSKVKALILNTTIKPLQLLKRMIYNRATLESKEILKYLGSHPKQNSHNLKSNEKLQLVLNKFDVNQYIRSYELGSFLGSSNIGTWKDDLTMIKEADLMRKNLKPLQNFSNRIIH